MAYKKLSEVDTEEIFDSILAIKDNSIRQINESSLKAQLGIDEILNAITLLENKYEELKSSITS